MLQFNMRCKHLVCFIQVNCVGGKFSLSDMVSHMSDVDSKKMV